MSDTVILLRPLGQREFGLRTFLRAFDDVVIIDEPTSAFASVGDRFVPVHDIKSETEVVDAVREVAHRGGFTGICTFVDYLLPVVGRINDEFGTRGLSHKSVKRCLDKMRQRDSFHDAGLPNPRYAAISSLRHLTRFFNECASPVVVKPRSRTGSVGVSLARTHEELRSAYDYAADEARGTGVMAEAYLDGIEYGVDVAMVGDNPKFVAVSEKDFYEGRFFIRRSHWFPADISTQQRDQLADIAKRAAAALGIRDAVVHVQLRITDSGPFIIEVNARVNGGFNADLLWHSTGINLYQAQIDLLRGVRPDFKPHRSMGAALREVLLPPGKVRQFTLLNAIPTAEQVICQQYVRDGATVAPARHGIDTHAVIGVTAATVGEARGTISRWERSLLAAAVIDSAESIKQS